MLCEEGLTFGGSSISTGYAGKVDGEVSKEEISVPLAMAGILMCVQQRELQT